MSDGKHYKSANMGIAYRLPPHCLELSHGGLCKHRAEATDAEVQRIEQAVKKTAEQAVANGQLSAVNQTQIKAVVDSLSQQQETLKATDEKLAQLIQIMLQKQ